MCGIRELLDLYKDFQAAYGRDHEFIVTSVYKAVRFSSAVPSSSGVKA